MGGGFAGLSAAVALAVQGVRVLVLEARPRLGGRATAFVDRVTGEVVDNGQHVLFGCYRETFQFLRTIGASDCVTLQPRLSVSMIEPEGRQTRLVCPPLPPPLHLLAGVLEWDALTWADRVSVLRLAAPLYRTRRHLARTPESRVVAEGVTVERWLIANGQTPRLRTLLWEPLAVAALNQSVAEAEADPFVRVLASMFGDDERDAAIALPRVPLDAMYAVPAQQFIERHGGEVRPNHSARLAFEGETLVGVDVGTHALRSRLVIVAVPWFALDDTVGSAPAAREALACVLSSAARMQSRPIVTVNLWFDRAVMDELFVGLPGRVMHWIFDKRFLGETTSHLALVSSGATAIVGSSNEDTIALAMADVLDALPRSRHATLRRATVVREKRATFSLAPGEPIRPPTVTAIPNLLLAGDWIATGLPSTIESAVTSGHRAAAAALETLRHGGQRDA